MSKDLLWSQLKSGDQQALATIYEQHFGFLYNYGKKIARDISTVEDAIQELFVELWERRSKLSETDSVRAYLTVAIRRKLVKKVKQAHKSVELDDALFGFDTAVEQPQLADGPDATLSKKIKSTLEHLPPRQKEILYLKYYGGMDYEEIADIMDMNYQSARNLVSRAIAKMTTYLTLINFMIFFVRNEYIESVICL